MPGCPGKSEVVFGQPLGDGPAVAGPPFGIVHISLEHKRIPGDSGDVDPGACGRGQDMADI